MTPNYSTVGEVKLRIYRGDQSTMRGFLPNCLDNSSKDPHWITLAMQCSGVREWRS